MGKENKIIPPRVGNSVIELKNKQHRKEEKQSVRCHSLQRLPHSSPGHFSPSLALARNNTPTVCRIQIFMKHELVCVYIYIYECVIIYQQKPTVSIYVSIYLFLSIKISAPTETADISEKTEFPGIMNSDKIAKGTPILLVSKPKGAEIGQRTKT